MARITAVRDDLSPALLGSGSWDAVLDMNAYFPAQIETAVAALTGRAGRYVLCITFSVYPSRRPYPLCEGEPTAPCSPEEAADTGMATYGARKAECERVIRILPTRDSVIRLLGALLLEQDEAWTTRHRYFEMHAYWRWRAEQAPAHSVQGGGPPPTQPVTARAARPADRR